MRSSQTQNQGLRHLSLTGSWALHVPYMSFSVCSSGSSSKGISPWWAQWKLKKPIKNQRFFTKINTEKPRVSSQTDAHPEQVLLLSDAKDPWGLDIWVVVSLRLGSLTKSTRPLGIPMSPACKVKKYHKVKHCLLKSILFLKVKNPFLSW